MPPQGLQETGIMAWTAVNHVVDHRPGGGGGVWEGKKREEDREYERQEGKSEWKT